MPVNLQHWKRTATRLLDLFHLLLLNIFLIFFFYNCFLFPPSYSLLFLKTESLVWEMYGRDDARVDAATGEIFGSIK